MDHVVDIKARLPIEELVRQYCQIQKKGRNFVSLCPFHNDTHPSFLISPDKGIAYCFACQKGGDIFSFYQLIEGVDFPQAVRELAEKVGIVIEQQEFAPQKKDEKDRMRECLTAALSLFRSNLSQAQSVQEYLTKRGVTPQERDTFQLGFAPDSFSGTYEQLLKGGFSKKEITASGLAIQKDLTDERIYDRFRNRLLFPIHDLQGRIAGFGGRTMGNDDAKYLNSPDSPLYRKSSILFGLHLAKEAMRERKKAIIVEGYFDVLACHRAGFANTVAACGTALTEEHAKILHRYVDAVVLCLDQDRAGRAAAERAYMVCSKEGLQVEGIVLPGKDPADVAVASLDELHTLLETSARPYLEIVYAEISASDLSSSSVRREALDRMLALLQAIPTVVERTHALRDAARALGTTESALEEDLRAARIANAPRGGRSAPMEEHQELFSSVEIALGLFLLYPQCRALLEQLLPPEDAFAAALYRVLKDGAELSTLEPPDRERADILSLYCDQHGFSQWNDRIAPKEIERNCQNANKDYIRRKQQAMTKQLVEAKKTGDSAQEERLLQEYQQLLNLAAKK